MLKFEDNYPLSKVTTLQIGGPAKKFVAVKSEAELKEAIEYAKNQQLPYLVIGGGSNLLVSDEGVDCLVIKNEISEIHTSKRPARNADGSLNDSREGFDSFEVSVKSGTSLQELVDFAINQGSAGIENLTGIPGTVGGAVYGHAGAYGQYISDYLTEVTTSDGQLFDKESCSFSYRDSIFKKNKAIILEVKFKLPPGEPKALKQEAEAVMAKRRIKYPPGIKCPGSFFKNLIAGEVPAEVLNLIPSEKIVFGKLPAGALLEEVGAKGQKLDGIEISPVHGNLFINKNGTAKSFYKLAEKYARKVKDKFGITLEPEVQLLNLPPFNL